METTSVQQTPSVNKPPIVAYPGRRQPFMVDLLYVMAALLLYRGLSQARSMLWNHAFSRFGIALTAGLIALGFSLIPWARIAHRTQYEKAYIRAFERNHFQLGLEIDCLHAAFNQLNRELANSWTLHNKAGCRYITIESFLPKIMHGAEIKDPQDVDAQTRWFYGIYSKQLCEVTKEACLSPYIPYANPYPHA